MLSGIQYVTGLLSKLVWGETEYILDLSRIGFIWFSDNPNEFMPVANQLRLIQNRLRNPDMDFYFVYSSKCLSQQAMNELQEFANTNNLYLIDFDTLLENADKTELDNDIFLIAKEERDHAIKNTGGSLAAASDGTRTLEPLLEICANYIDCDVDFDFSQMPRFHRINVPVIIPGRAHDVGMGFKFPLIGNSFVGVAVTSEGDPSLHPEAKEKLNWVKEKIQKHYFNPSIDTLLREFTGTPTIAALNPALNLCVQKLFSRCQNDIFAYRQALSSITSMTLHHKLYKESVIKYSGPDAWAHLFKDTLEMCNGMELPLMMEIFLEELEKANELQNGLTECFLYNVNPDQNIEGLPKSDLSWTPYGKEKMRERSEEIDKSITMLQAHCRGYLARSKCR